MPRVPRHFLPDVPIHVIQRGNNRACCFFTHRDYVVYLDKLYEYSRKFNVAIHAFVLMTNHAHLLVTPADTTGASGLMQALGRYYVRYINTTRKRTGTLWEGRFKGSLVDSERYLLTLSRYIELNPVRAGMVRDPADYKWSSYRMNALGKNIRLLTPHPLFLELGRSAEECRAAYQALFVEALPDQTLNQIRTAANKGLVLGDEQFRLEVESRLGRKLPPFERGGDRKLSAYTRKPIKLV